MSSSIPQYTLFFYVPKPHTLAVCQAVFKAGAGTYPGGLYSEACFISSGIGSFRPNPGANPNIGKVGEVEKVEEDKVETICVGEDTMREAVRALKEAHPYEQVAYGVLRLEDI